MTEESEVALNEAMDKELGAVYDQVMTDDDTDAPEAPKVEEPAGQVKDVPPAEKPETETKELPEGTEAPKEAVSPPASWSAGAKAKFHELPPDIQQEVLKRESDVDRGFAQYADDRKFAREIQQVVRPYEAMIAAEGGTPATAFQDLLNTAYQLRMGTPAQKAQLISDVAQQFGVDLSLLGSPEATQPVDPGLAAIHQNQETIMQHLRANDLEKKQREDKENLSVVESFGADPKNTHFKDVSEDMVALMPAIKAKFPGESRGEWLKKAYEAAIYANPTVRQKVVEAELKAQDAKRIEEAKKASANAKKAVGTNLSTKSSPSSGQQETSSFEETAGDIWDSMMGNAA